LLTGLLRQPVFGRLAGYEDVNDAGRLSRDPAMRAIVDRMGPDRIAALTNQMARFETQWLASEDNLSGSWIERVHEHKAPKMIVLDMDSSESRRMACRRARPTMAASAAPVIIHCSCSTSSVIWNSPRSVGATSIAPMTGDRRWSRLSRATGVAILAAISAPRDLLRLILGLIDGLRPKPVARC
jgi:hypothetical protein